MQYHVYKNRSNSKDYPLLLDVQSDLIQAVDARVVIPLCRLADYRGRKRVERLNPVLHIEGEDYLLLAYDLAGVGLSVIGDEVCSAIQHRNTIKSALDLIFDGF